MEFRNEENFKKFLDENVKSKVYDFQAYLDDLTEQYMSTGVAEYEVEQIDTYGDGSQYTTIYIF